MKIDAAVFGAINGYSRKSRALDFFAIACAEYIGYVILVVLLVAAYVAKDWRMFVIPVAAGLVSRFAIAQAIYFFYQRKRPVEVLPISALVKKPNHPAFPSGHASFFFAVSFAVFLFSYPLAITFVVACCVMALARVFCGVHWPFDVVAGALVAALTALLFWQLL